MQGKTDFERAAQAAAPSLPRQMLGFLIVNRNWWLLPIVGVLGGIGLLTLLAGGGAAPFIYTLF